VQTVDTTDFDLVVVDMMMPGRTGIDVAAHLRADPAKATLPVVMLTARAQAEDKANAEKAGVTRFLTKPFSPAALRETVDELLAAGR
jgi:CheY-like chemotaxis protein